METDFDQHRRNLILDYWINDDTHTHRQYVVEIRSYRIIALDIHDQKNWCFRQSRRLNTRRRWRNWCKISENNQGVLVKKKKKEHTAHSLVRANKKNQEKSRIKWQTSRRNQFASFWVIQRHLQCFGSRLTFSNATCNPTSCKKTKMQKNGQMNKVYN